MKVTLKVLGTVALVGLLCAGCSTTGGGGPSDEDLIQAVMADMGAAIAVQDIAKAMTAYADNYENDQGMDKAGQSEFLQGAADQGFLDDMTVDNSGSQVVIDGNKATVGPNVIEGAFGTITIEYELEKQNGQWLIVYSSQG